MAKKITIVDIIIYIAISVFAMYCGFMIGFKLFYSLDPFKNVVIFVFVAAIVGAVLSVLYEELKTKAVSK